VGSAKLPALVIQASPAGSIVNASLYGGVSAKRLPAKTRKPSEEKNADQKDCYSLLYNIKDSGRLVV
jgi:hypothetical protein